MSTSRAARLADRWTLLSAPHVEIRRTVRDFAEREILPVADEMERKAEFPTEIIRKAAGLGHARRPYPEEEGGAGLDTLAYAIAVEELSRVWGSLGIIVARTRQPRLQPDPHGGHAEQKERFLVPMASGKVIGAYGLTEPEAGCDSGATRTTARFEDGDGGCWVLNGRKRFITNAGRGRNIRRDRRTGDRDDGLAPRSAPSSSPRTRRLLDRPAGGEAGPARQRDRRAAVRRLPHPGQNLSASEGDGWKIFLKTLDGGRISIGAMARRPRPGGAGASVRVRARAEAVRPADRLLPGGRVHDRRHGDGDGGGAADGLSGGVAEGPGQATTTAAARRPSSSQAKCRSASTNEGVQVHGGYGYVEEYKVERFMRDAKLTELGEGTSQIQRLVIGRNLLGLRAM